MNLAAGLQIHPLRHECGIRAATTLPSSPPSVSEFTCCYATSRDIVACTSVCACGYGNVDAFPPHRYRPWQPLRIANEIDATVSDKGAIVMSHTQFL